MLQKDNSFTFDIQLFADEVSAEPTTEAEETNEPNEDIVDESVNDETVSSDTPSNEEGNHEKDSEPASEDLDGEYDFSDVWGEDDEVDQAMVETFSEKFKELNLNKEQANAVMKMGVEFGRSIAESFEYAREQELIAKREEVEQVLGKDLEGTLRQAGAAVEVVTKQIPNFKEWLEETGMGDDINMIRLCSILGGLVSEDRGHLGKGQSVTTGDPLRARWNNSPEMFK